MLLLHPEEEKNGRAVRNKSQNASEYCEIESMLYFHTQTHINVQQTHEIKVNMSACVCVSEEKVWKKPKLLVIHLVEFSSSTWRLHLMVNAC